MCQAPRPRLRLLAKALQPSMRVKRRGKLEWWLKSRGLFSESAVWPTPGMPLSVEFEDKPASLLVHRNKLTSPCGKPSSSRMSLQWTAVATFLYAEVFVVLLLCIPFISPKRWQKIFKSRLVELVVSYGNTFFVVLIVILVLLVIDAVREIRKYDDVTEKVNLQNNPGAMEHFHMKLFRAQRNLYIAGFSLLLSFLLRRLVTLISQQATLLASNEAFKKQAESASEAAKKYMEENDQLKKGAAVDGGKLDVGNAEVKLEAENRSLKADLQKLNDELASTKQKLEKAENQVLAMRKQSEGLTKEYDRLLEEHAKLQAAVDGPVDKKEE